MSTKCNKRDDFNWKKWNSNSLIVKSKQVRIRNRNSIKLLKDEGRAINDSTKYFDSNTLHFIQWLRVFQPIIPSIAQHFLNFSLNHDAFLSISNSDSNSEIPLGTHHYWFRRGWFRFTNLLTDMMWNIKIPSIVDWLQSFFHQIGRMDGSEHEFCIKRHC